ncbi:YkgJ family cysteine cluster protein [Desulfofundulus thermobenzoicus]|uniref:YkgJ family cysteine cluster protein n=1 Tax=Desulfofundulus thermobenzoicus TaxID=29376 RepID=UPI00128FB049|nr:YkgJ family cysteine cluster protein [Desulfofundulus thermobenzoicus]
MSHQERDHCIRCGTCCLKGGPVLHHEDKRLLRDGHIGYQNLVTIRKGERAYDPFTDTVKPVAQELIKVRGAGKEWSCCFYDPQHSACTIYEHRFFECRLLNCWDPAPLVDAAGKNTITRADIINAHDPILEVIAMHEQVCPYDEVEELLAGLSREEEKAEVKARLNDLVRKDLAIREYALSELGLRGEFELFIFGRPLFKVLGAITSAGALLPR